MPAAAERRLPRVWAALGRMSSSGCGPAGQGSNMLRMRGCHSGSGLVIPYPACTKGLTKMRCCILGLAVAGALMLRAHLSIRDLNWKLKPMKSFDKACCFSMSFLE